MKLISLTGLLCLIASLVSAQESASIDRPVADETVAEFSPPPAPLVVRPRDILASKTSRMKDRDLIVQRIRPEVLPTIAEPVPVANSELIEKSFQPVDEIPCETVLLMATTYRSAILAEKPLTFLQLQMEGKSGPVEAWSDTDFRWLQGFSSFSTVGSNGTKIRQYSLLLMSSHVPVSRLAEIGEIHGRPVSLFQAGESAFKIVSADAGPVAIRRLQVLHDLLNGPDRETLRLAHENRERLRVETEVSQKLRRSAAKKPLILRYARIDRSAMKGGDQ